MEGGGGSTDKLAVQELVSGNIGAVHQGGGDYINPIAGQAQNWEKHADIVHLRSKIEHYKRAVDTAANKADAQERVQQLKIELVELDEIQDEKK